MGSRKVRPKKPPPLPSRGLEAVALDEQHLRPSSAMTREVEAVIAPHPAFAEPNRGVAESAVRTARSAVAMVPLAADTTRSLDDLAQTLEGPAAPRLLLLDAAEALLVEVGFTQLTETEVARRAGVPLEIARAHFANKRALLSAMNDRFCAQATTVTNDATRTGIWDNATPRDVIEVTVKSILDVVLGRAALVRAILASEDETLIAAFRRVGANLTERVSRVLEGTHGAPEDKPDSRDVAFAFLVAVSLAHHAIMVGTEWSGVTFDRAELYERATKAATAHIQARPRPS